MGWGLDHPLGEKFAYSVQPGDLILIARSHNKQPEIVGFGRVTGKFKTSIKGFTPPVPFSTLRTLSPFKAMSRPPRNIPLIAALNQSAAIHELHPDWNTAHESICAWMDEKLSVPDERQAKKLSANAGTGVILGSMQNDQQLEYQVRNLLSVKKAIKREAELVMRFREWVNAQDRELHLFKARGIQCDAYEKERRNLIEAKCSMGRQHIRMAVGQLLDYSFVAREALGDCYKAILLPSKPDDAILEWLKTIDISVIWEDHACFLDNDNGRFA